MAVDWNGNVFVADYLNGAVKEIVALFGSIQASPTIRTIASGLNGPDGVAVDANGNVFVANYGDDTVMEIVAVNGSIPASPTIKTIGSGFSMPSNISVDGIGNVFVSDSGNNAIKEILAAGGYTTVKVLGSGFNFPEGVAVDQNGDVMVADTGNDAVAFLDYADPPTLTFARCGGGLQQQRQPAEGDLDQRRQCGSDLPGAGVGRQSQRIRQFCSGMPLPPANRPLQVQRSPFRLREGQAAAWPSTLNRRC